MIRRMRHAAAVLAMACMMTVMMPAQMITAFAANARIAFSDPSATVGGKIKVNMKITSSDNPVSYTHLDVYKRQLFAQVGFEHFQVAACQLPDGM